LVVVTFKGDFRKLVFAAIDAKSIANTVASAVNSVAKSAVAATTTIAAGTSTASSAGATRRLLNTTSLKTDSNHQLAYASMAFFSFAPIAYYTLTITFTCCVWQFFDTGVEEILELIP
jgi:hypothetical protein